MLKIEDNSVNYNSLIGSDFKNVVSSRQGHRHRIPLVLSLAIGFMSAIVISVVLAHSNQSTPSDSKLPQANLFGSSLSSSNLSSASLSNTNFSDSNSTDVSLPIKPDDKSAKKLALNISEDHFKNLQDAIVIEESVSAPLENENRVTVEIKKGDTLSSIFKELDIHSELTRVLNLGKEAKPLKRIFPGQKIHFTFSDSGLDKIELEKSITKSLFLYRNEDSYLIEEASRELDKISQVAVGKINNSLFLAGQDAGMSDALIMELAGIFGWDIDFALDIRVGDTFTVLYEELFLDGEKVGDGNIIAAEFFNNGTSYRAYRYTDSNNKTEYYSPDGKSMRKPFMRTPVALGRISSYFNLKRKHPILNKIRAHKGVDYAAPTGTAIKATGDGKVVHRGNKGGYGKTIILRHGNTYTTLYAHMSKYSRKTGVGSRVKQGQIIGYIGRTGLATGPHLHYEFRVNGVHRNPLKVKLPSAKPLPDSEMDRFQSSIQPLVVQMDAYSQNALVLRDL